MSNPLASDETAAILQRALRSEGFNVTVTFEDATVSDPYYVINRNEGEDTLHRNPREECNVDDAEGRSTVDAATGRALELSGDIRKCQHCLKETAT